jgi:hypothetical protein
MSTVSGGRNLYLITPDLIDSVVTDTTGRTSYTITTGADGGAIVTVTMIGALPNGCASNNGVVVLLKDFVKWTRVHCTFTSTGTSSCWGWNGDNGYGAGLTTPTGNLAAYNANAGDFTYNEFNVWNLPQFRKYFSACDNNSDNYMHNSFRVGASRGFTMFSRRSSMHSLAGPSHGRTCTAVVDGTITFSSMKVVI